MPSVVVGLCAPERVDQATRGQSARRPKRVAPNTFNLILCFGKRNEIHAESILPQNYPEVTCDTCGSWGSSVARGTLWDVWGPAEATRECDGHLRVAESMRAKRSLGARNKMAAVDVKNSRETNP